MRERDLITDRIPIDFVNQSASRSPGHIISDLGMSELSGLLAHVCHFLTLPSLMFTG